MATIADFFINFLKRPKFTFHPVYYNLNPFYILEVDKKFMLVIKHNFFTAQLFSGLYLRCASSFYIRHTFKFDPRKNSVVKKIVLS